MTGKEQKSALFDQFKAHAGEICGGVLGGLLFCAIAAKALLAITIATGGPIGAVVLGAMGVCGIGMALLAHTVFRKKGNLALVTPSAAVFVLPAIVGYIADVCSVAQFHLPEMLYFFGHTFMWLASGSLLTAALLGVYAGRSAGRFLFDKRRAARLPVAVA